MWCDIFDHKSSKTLLIMCSKLKIFLQYETRLFSRNSEAVIFFTGIVAERKESEKRKVSPL